MCGQGRKPCPFIFDEVEKVADLFYLKQAAGRTIIPRTLDVSGFFYIRIVLTLDFGPWTLNVVI
jgi:hypothetical protein